jgi:hypothetical protein
MEGLSMIESIVSLSYAERLKAGLAVASGRIANILWLCFFPVCGIVILSLPPHRWFDAVMAILCFGFVPVAFLLSAHRGQKTAERNGPFTYRLSPEGFELRSRTAELKQSWAGIPRVRASNGFLLIYANKRCAYPLPIRLLSTDQMESVFAWAKAGGAERVGA